MKTQFFFHLKVFGITIIEWHILEIICYVLNHLSVLVHFQVLFWYIFYCYNKMYGIRLFIRKNIYFYSCFKKLIKFLDFFSAYGEGFIAEMQRPNRYFQRLHTEGVTFLYYWWIAASFGHHHCSISHCVCNQCYKILIA